MRKFFHKIMVGLVGLCSVVASECDTPTYEKPAEQSNADQFLDLYAAHLRSTPSQKTDELHQQEVEHLYKEYAADFCQNLLAENPSYYNERMVWMGKFFTLNPLSPLLLQYGLEKIPPSLEELSLKYNQLFSLEMREKNQQYSGQIKYHTLASKFGERAIIGLIGPIGRLGVYPAHSYLDELDRLRVEYEWKIEKLDNAYLYKKENLKHSFSYRLIEIASNIMSDNIPLIELQALNDLFDYDLKCLKVPYIAEMKRLKTKYLESLQELKRQFSEQETHQDDLLEDPLKHRWYRLKTIFEEWGGISKEEHYKEARNLLEDLKKN